MELRKAKEWIAFLLALALFFTVAWFGAKLLMPVRTAYGCLWDAIRREEPESVELMIVGSSMAYCDIAPAYLWEQTGLDAYVVAGPEQTLPISYYYIREACRTQSPKWLMLEMTEMFFPKVGHYTLANISYMPFSVNRIGAVFAGAEPEKRFGLLFPLYSYHDRWQDVGPGELLAHLQRPEADRLAGYTLLTQVTPAPEPAERDFTADSEDYRTALRYLDKIVAYCAAQGIELIPYIAPSNGKIPAPALETLRGDLTARGLPLTDFNDYFDEIGFDGETDWYDLNHLNLRGAEKFSRWLAGYLTDAAGVTPAGTADAAVWSERLDYLAQQRAAMG